MRRMFMSAKPKRSRGHWKSGNPTLKAYLGSATEVMFFKAHVTHRSRLLEYELRKRELPWYRVAHVLIKRGLYECGFSSAQVRR